MGRGSPGTMHAPEPYALCRPATHSWCLAQAATRRELTLLGCGMRRVPHTFMEKYIARYRAHRPIKQMKMTISAGLNQGLGSGLLQNICRRESTTAAAATAPVGKKLRDVSCCARVRHPGGRATCIVRLRHLQAGL